MVPVIVAESLERVDSPLETMLREVEPGDPREIVARMAGALARTIDARPVPEWLRPEQRLACSRLLAILDRYRGALLADPVGSGKTYVALGVAAVRRDDAPTVVVVPAALIKQWERAAANTGVSIMAWSHERVSRGRLPPILDHTPRSTLVIIDESHHFRSPAAERYRHLAPRLPGREVLLLSATPIVNRLDDLAAQLALGIGDDALHAFGIPSIREHLRKESRAASPALAELVLSSRIPVSDRPTRVSRREHDVGFEGELEPHCRRIEALALSSHPATSALVRSVIWRAMASSDMALLAVLRRYRALLLQSRDAMLTGKSLTRSALRSLAGEAADQLIMWELFPHQEAAADLVQADLIPLDSLIEDFRHRCHGADRKCRRLASILADGAPTLVFTGARETVRYLRCHFPRAAWCTGSESGIGITRMNRDDVMSWFRPGRPATGGPTVLITTDVSSEGLDLQSAARVVHYDLPWTSVRMDQRDGRALRLGSKHEQVEVIRFDLPEEIERRLRLVHTIADKRLLPRRIGILPERQPWSWRDEIAGRFGEPAPGDSPQCCRVQAEEFGILAGFSVLVHDLNRQKAHRVASTLGYLDSAGAWDESPDVITRKLEAAERGASVSLHPGDIESAVRAVAGIIRQRLKAIHLDQWAQRLSPLQSCLLARLHRIATRAVHTRNGSLLSSLERAIDFVRRGHTAGERLWLERMAELPDSALIGALRKCPETRPRLTTIYSQLHGLIIFVPSSSISMER